MKANTVREASQLHFLQDVVPPTVPVREALEKRKNAGEKTKRAPYVPQDEVEGEEEVEGEQDEEDVDVDQGHESASDAGDA
jgi:hypothetical protein